MKHKLFLFLNTLFFFFLLSCTQEAIINEYPDLNQDNTSYLGNDEYQIDLEVDDAHKRTRVVDFSPNSSIRLNQIWLGAFEYESGTLVSSQTKTMDYRTILTGEIQRGLVRIFLNKPAQESTGYVVVCLANYLGVTDENGIELEQRLSEVKTWEDFNSIAVDVKTAYSNMHNGIVPVLAGFVYNDDNDDTHIKIDQFKQGDNATRAGGVLLSPSHRINSVIIKTDDNGNFNFTSSLLKLRRLVANINVKIQVNNSDLLLTDVTYKRFNMPKGVYIIERRTTDCKVDADGSYTTGKFAPSDRPDQSPNWADIDPRNRYESDSEWQYGNTNGFSFQHFANKHWARKDLTEQTDREKCYKYGVDENNNNLYYYDALVDDNKQEDFNNYASYFVIKMHLIDKSSGKALEAEYTIHEGYTSDELGAGIDVSTTDDEKIKTRLKDFVVARNIDYTYTIHIEGVSNIYHNVNIGNGSGEDMEHHNGQGGKVCQFYYVNDYYDVDGNRPSGDSRLVTPGDKCSYNDINGSYVNTVPYTGGTFKNAIKITRRNPDLSFRLYGYTNKNSRIDGYNYNFPQESFSYLNKLWPPSAGLTSHYFLNYNELISNGEEIPEELLNGLKIIDPQNDQKGEMNVVDFITYMKDQETKTEIDLPRYFDVKVYPSNIDEKDSPYKNDYVRAIYLTDRTGEPDEVDGCTRVVNIFAAAQYPKLNEIVQKVKLEVPGNINLDFKYNYNILEPSIKNLNVPVLRTVVDNQEQYEYELRIAETGKSWEEATIFSNYGVRDAMGNNWVYNIPMNKFPWKEGDVYLKVISKVPDKFEDSDPKKIGKITLNNHDAWYNTEPEWKSLIDNYSTANSGDNTGTYLRFHSTDPAKTFTRGSDNNIYHIVTAGGACTFEFNVYKACKISVIMRTSSSGNARGIKLTDANGEQYSKEEGGTDWKTYEFTVLENSKSEIGENLIKLNSTSGGIQIRSIAVSPL